MTPAKLESKSTKGSYFRAALGAALLATSLSLPGQVLNVPNASFESQSGLGQPFGVSINIDSWQKADRPAYFPAAGFNGFFWVQTAGMFHVPAYGNQLGNQASYLLSFPQAGIFQDYNTLDWNDAAPTQDFNSIFEAGKSYKLTLGLYGKSMIENFSSLELSLYYRDGGNALTTVGSTTVTFSSTLFATSGPFSLIDYEVNVPTVLATDAWAGQNIGIRIASIQGDGNGYWDFDNLRLEAIPEPSSVTLLGLGLGGWLLNSWHRRRRI